LLITVGVVIVTEQWTEGDRV